MECPQCGCEIKEGDDRFSLYLPLPYEESEEEISEEGTDRRDLLGFWSESEEEGIVPIGLWPESDEEISQEEDEDCAPMLVAAKRGDVDEFIEACRGGYMDPFVHLDLVKHALGSGFFHGVAREILIVYRIGGSPRICEVLEAFFTAFKKGKLGEMVGVLSELYSEFEMTIRVDTFPVGMSDKDVVDNISKTLLYSCSSDRWGIALTALTSASVEGRRYVVEALLAYLKSGEANGLGSSEVRDYPEPLLAASGAGQLQMTKRLLKVYSPEKAKLALVSAAFGGQSKVLGVLLERCADNGAAEVARCVALQQGHFRVAGELALRMLS